jgi:sugar (pentulose or hexulose) kinase
VSIVPAATRIGALSAEAAEACGLSAGVALVAGFLGVGLVDAGQVIDVAGTFPVLATALDRFLPGARGATFQALADLHGVHAALARLRSMALPAVEDTD